MTNPTPVRRWQPGQSGNPSGRAKEVAMALRAGRAQFLKEYPRMNDLWIRHGLGDIELEPSQLHVIEKIYDRYFGRPFQSIDIDSEEFNSDDASSIPNMTHQDMQMYRNKMVMELIYTLNEDGRLDNMLRLIEDGWRPDSIDVESVTITQEEPKKPKKAKQLAIEGKR